MTPLVRPLRGALALNGPEVVCRWQRWQGLRILTSELEASCGRYLSPRLSDGQPVSKDDKVYFGSEDGTLLALEEATGSSYGGTELREPYVDPWLSLKKLCSLDQATVTFMP